MITKLSATVVGWYGTETIGDRAILAGIIRMLSEVSSSVTLHLGSLFPVLSERTLHDDGGFFERCAHNSSLQITLFDSQSWRQLENSIKCSDVLIIGGGPLMDIEQMFMLEYAVRYAKHKKKRTIALGCGYGPLNNRETVGCANRLLDLLDLSIMRDSNAPYASISNLIDPAAFACTEFLGFFEGKNSKYCAVNFRDVFSLENHYPSSSEAENRIIEWFSSFVEKSDVPVCLIPMHTFSVGYDDRLFLDKMARKINSSKVEVISTPPSLQETMALYHNAQACIGMRFHSVLLQTILNGKNAILDYTHPQTGKIISLMRQMNMEEFYCGRYVSLYKDVDSIEFDLDEERRFLFSKDLVSTHFSVYVDSIKQVICG